MPESFYARDTVTVARDLLGKVVVHGNAAGRIVEVEAYVAGDDLAAHFARGMTERTRVVYGPPGRAYVYFIYGMYDCLNFVTEPEGQAGAVLIRALEPLAGVEEMFRRRPKAGSVEQLCSGPGKLTLAMGITRALNGHDCTRPGTLHVERGPRREIHIVTSSRIGITKCADWPLRFYEAHSRFVSRRGA